MTREIWLLICGIGAVQSLFFAVYLLVAAGKRTLPNLLLAGVFMALTLRVTKSIFWVFWDAPQWALNLGFAAHWFVGPLLWMYFRQLRQVSPSIPVWHWLHLSPALLLVVFSPWLDWVSFWQPFGYTTLLFVQLGYFAACFWPLLTGQPLFPNHIDRPTRGWLIVLWTGLLVWHGAYFANYVLEWTSYILGPALYSVIIYSLSFYGLRYRSIFQPKEKPERYRHINLSDSDLKQYKSKLLTLMDGQRPYLDPNLTLAGLSDSLQIQPYILSHLINDGLGRNFSEFVNGYRIKEAQSRLRDPQQSHLKIASISFDCGFNSVSSFNSAFKKMAGQTPSEFRRSVG